MKTKTKMQLKKKKPKLKPKPKRSKEAKLILSAAVRSVFETDAPDPVLYGEIRTALSSPRRRETVRTRLIACLLRGRIRSLAKEMIKTKPLWMSDISHLRLRRAMKKYKQGV